MTCRVGKRMFVALGIGIMSLTSPRVTQADAPVSQRATDVPDGFTFAAVGDLLQVRPLMPLQTPAFLAVNRIVREADVAFGNDEMPLINVAAKDVYPEAENGGANLYGLPSVAADFKSQGFTMVSRANNHSTDWGITGMNMTDAALDAAGIMHAGTGRDDVAARSARLVETQWGRMALVSTTTTFEGDEPAGAPSGDVAARPGVSVIHTVQTMIVDRATLDGLKRYYGAAAYHTDDKVTADGITIFGQPYAVGSSAGVRYDMDKGDLSSTLRAIRQGNAVSNFLVFSVHAHESATGVDNDIPQGNFFHDLAHDAIDSGADIVVGHGPHQVGAIEIYKGRPIFYSLGNYVFQLDLGENVYPEGWAQFGLASSRSTDADFYRTFLHHYFWHPQYWQSVAVVITYRHNAAEKILLYPLDLGMNRPSHLRGVPELASPEEGETILKRIETLSAPYGTHVEIHGGVGTIRLT